MHHSPMTKVSSRNISRFLPYLLSLGAVVLLGDTLFDAVMAVLRLAGHDVRPVSWLFLESVILLRKAAFAICCWFLAAAARELYAEGDRYAALPAMRVWLAVFCGAFLLEQGVTAAYLLPALFRPGGVPGTWSLLLNAAADGVAAIAAFVLRDLLLPQE